jgi:hypothetical protein
MNTTEKIKFVLVFTISMLFATNTNAQDAKNHEQGFKMGIGLNAGYALSDPYKLVLGANTRLQYNLTKRYSLTFTTGFTNLFVDKSVRSDLGFIPVKASFKAFVWNDQFYLMGEAGAAIAVTNNYNKTSLLLAPSLGYTTKYIDISLRYEHYNDFPKLNNNGSTGKGLGQLGVRLAYGFDL